ncbi:MAG: DNA polymerase IV [Eubacteriales bacterium]|nr:DNA polymerase IV [Eubacteriales bacterium]
MERCILHVDCNCFYASVEMLHRPETREVPMAVGGSEERRHGIILAKNDLAKKCGISTAEPLWSARQKCPELLIIPPNFPLYLDFSRRVKKIFSDYTDQVESFGIDEAWLDVTGSIQLFGSGEHIAHEIRQRVKQELGITVSVGVSWNKVFAKLGSDLKKPDAVTMVTPENYQAVVCPLPVNALLYVGRSTEKKLGQLGIHTIGQLAQMSCEFLRGKFGKTGELLWSYANGLDTSPVAHQDERAPIKSIGNSTTTIRDITTPEEARLVFTVLAESVGTRLREQGLFCRTISISTRTVKLSRTEHQCTLSRPSNETRTILQTALALFTQGYSWNHPLRSLGIQLSGLTAASDPLQLDLFTDPADLLRQSQLDRTVDQVRKRFGKASVLRASILLDPALTGFDPKHQIQTIGFH